MDVEIVYRGKGGFKGVVSAVGKGIPTACFSYPRLKFI